MNGEDDSLSEDSTERAERQGLHVELLAMNHIDHSLRPEQMGGRGPRKAQVGKATAGSAYIGLHRSYFIPRGAQPLRKGACEGPDSGRRVQQIRSPQEHPHGRPIRSNVHNGWRKCAHPKGGRPRGA